MAPACHRAQSALEARRVPDGEELLGVRPASFTAHLLGAAQIDVERAVGSATVTIASTGDVGMSGVENLGHGNSFRYVHNMVLVTIIPDDKDWTWVLERPCPECRFDSSTLPRDHIAPLTRSNARSWQEILAGDPERLRLRTRGDRWSPLEYACHVRDVFGLYGARLQLMVTQDDPKFPNWDQDGSAIEDHYADQDPVAVSPQLFAAAQALADGFDQVDADGWRRTGVRGDGAHFTVESFGRYMIHDPVHHLHDVRVDLGGTGPSQ